MEKSLAELIEETGGEIHGDPHKVIRGIAPFDEAGIDDITFADSPKILKRVSETNAGAVIVPRNFQQDVSINLIKSDNPRLALAKIMNFCFPVRPPAETISPRASVGQNVSFGNDVSVGPLAVIEDNVTIGSRVIIHPHVVIGNGVTIGDDVVVFPNVTILDRCAIGNRVVIHPGTVIGSDGYGFVPDGEKHYKIPQLGIVQIDDDVEIGACNTIDRATFGKTWIKQGVKTDNHVQIAHNVVIGENTLIVAQVGIAGSATIGKSVILAGQAGIGGHITVGDYVTVGPQAGVTRSVPEGQVVSGTPEMPHKLWLRVSRMIPRLPELKRKINDIEKRLDAFSKK
ncbi:MAG: UDP-3-O-(3-hydroxymyristoyl)glucosamine N-acyltransferase [Desulfobacterales bacterium]|nr:UDP-3-O-(3-hydroxymyristoyl)glucosamine N-acyltransferase [Desulfobacterales bacterium]